MSDPTPDTLSPAGTPASRQAFARAFASLLPDLRRSARRLSRSIEDADDLVQDTLLRVWARLAITRAEATDHAPITDLRAYTFATLRNCARSRAAGALPAPSEPQDARTTHEAAEGLPDDRAGTEGRLAAIAAVAALDALPEDQRKLLMLRVVDGLSYAEIAAATGLPMGTVTSRLSRGRRALRRSLGLTADAGVAELFAAGGG